MWPVRRPPDALLGTKIVRVDEYVRDSGSTVHSVEISADVLPDSMDEDEGLPTIVA